MGGNGRDGKDRAKMMGKARKGIEGGAQGRGERGGMGDGGNEGGKGWRDGVRRAVDGEEGRDGWE